MAKSKKEDEDPYKSVINLWNNTLTTVYDIVENKKKEQYAEGVLLLSTLLEEQLLQLIGIKLNFSKLYERYDVEDVFRLIDKYFFNREFTLHKRIQIVKMLNLINDETYKNLESFRKKRNIFMHEYYQKPINPEKMLKLTLKIYSPLIDNWNYYSKKIWN